ncbi:MAG TPA: signal peptidase II [Longimicrobiales bacterium]|nr:signal peptidase II [Longimicrobiales bacterium]
MKLRLSLSLLVVTSIVLADIVTKRWALNTLWYGGPQESLGGLVPLTLAFNKGIAFGLPLPATAGRWLIIGLTFVILFVLADIFRRAAAGDWLRIMAIQFVAAGAIGNLIDRVRWDGGVVDFIGPINLGFMHWPIFNIADMAITTGAVLLGISLLREETAAAKAQAQRSPVAASDTAH